MSLRKIKTYEQLDNILFDIDYETLSDQDIENLCNKVMEICNRRIENIKKTEVDSDVIISAVAEETKEANDRCFRLRNCTEKRIRQNILREQENGVERTLHQ